MRLRRELLVLLVLLTLLAIQGCTTPGVACDMKTEYESESPMALTGNVRFAWRFRSELPLLVYGLTNCTRGDDPLCLVRLKGDPPHFNDVCALAKFGHEVLHVGGATHE